MDTLRAFLRTTMLGQSEDEIEAEVTRIWFNEDAYMDFLLHFLDTPLPMM